MHKKKLLCLVLIIAISVTRTYFIEKLDSDETFLNNTERHRQEVHVGYFSKYDLRRE